MQTRRLAGRSPLGLLAACLITGGLAGAQTAEPVQRENLAFGKAATASSTQDDSKWAGAAIDGEPDTRWCAADGSAPQSLQVDLGRPEALTGCRITWESPSPRYVYKVEGSPDGKGWTVLAESQAATDEQPKRNHAFNAPATRFVRLSVTGLPEGQWASVFEFEVFGTQPATALAKKQPKATDQSSILKEIKVPAGFEATVFAAPPNVRYPTCLAAAPTGEVFVGIDENGSLDAKANRGRVVRCVDKDGDGRADEFNDFATMDSPRGLVWDAGTLYVLHPPSLSAYRDTNGDGTADRSEVLVSGIGFDLKHRGADHTTNGIRLAIDGFLYVAVGDYGFVRAQAKDGEPLQLLGGGVVRVRTDGTGLEIVSRGQRNIYDVAISPTMDLFTRDNTNDGDGWDVRLSHVVPTGNYGYPSLFKRFGAEIIPPLADYGGGSPCGSLFLQEPGFPAGYGNTLYTCEWGRGAVFMHPLKPKGSTFEAGQESFVTIPRPTDIDVDGSGRIFISTWRDGGFTYSKPNVGYVVRVVPQDLKVQPFPHLETAIPEALVQCIAADSGVLRLAAQRELLRRGVNANDTTVQQLETAAKSPAVSLAGRVAAVLTLAQAIGPQADRFLVNLALENANLREFAIKALADRRDPATQGPGVAPTIAAMLSDTEPRVRLAAVVAAGRLNLGQTAPTLLPLTNDPDPIVAHAAVQCLVRLRAIDDCLGALAGPIAAVGAARALQAIHDPRVVAGLVAVAEGEQGEGACRPALAALCRLYYTEAPYVQGQWWGTRPDTSGPYYKPITWSGSDAIAKALRAAIGKADPTQARWLLNEMIRNKLDFEETTALALKYAAADTELRASVVDLMAARPRLSPDAIQSLTAISNHPAADAVSVRALRALLKHQNQPEARTAAEAVLARTGAGDDPGGDFLGVWTEYARDNRRLRDLGSFVRAAEGTDAGAATLGYAVLIAAAANSKAPAAAQATAEAALVHAWEVPGLTARLVRAVALVKATSFNAKIRSLLGDDRTEVRQAAEFAAQRLNLAAPTAVTATNAPKPIATTAYAAVLAGVLADPGDAPLGAQLFERQGCVNCHAVAKSGPIKGPYLGDVAARYNRSELVESILQPSARIAQGFETQKLALANGQTLEGFVVREAGDEVELRNSTGNVVVVSKADIEERGKGELSVMPQGLMDPLTPHDLASLLAYFESIKGK